MKITILFLFSLSRIIVGFAQKPVIDSSVYDKWPMLEYKAAISNDGNYVYYLVENEPIGSNTLVIKAINNSWKMEIQGLEPYPQVGFTQDSRVILFAKPGDSLGVLILGASSVEYISHVSSFHLAETGTAEWVAYKLNNPENELIVRNLVNGTLKRFSSVMNYLCSKDGKTLVLEVHALKDTNSANSVQWIQIEENTSKTIWQGNQAGNFVLDACDSQLVFIAETKANDTDKFHSLWYYKIGTDEANEVADDNSHTIEDNLQLGNIRAFNTDGNSLFITLKEKVGPKPNPDSVQVVVWSYRDPKLKSQELHGHAQGNYNAVLNFKTHRIIRIEQANEQQISDDNNNVDVLVFHNDEDVDPGEANWNPLWQRSAFLVSTRTGERKQIRTNAHINFDMSPQGKYIIYWDPSKQNYLSYTVSSGETRNITSAIHTIWTRYNNDYPGGSKKGVDALVGWLDDDAAVLLHDQHDIWLVDLTGSKDPVNITNGYGRRKNIEFGIATKKRGSTFAYKEKIFLTAFDRDTKYSGFYSKAIDKKGDPDSLTMGPFLYYLAGISKGTSTQKALNAELFLVRRMSVDESPNYFCTKDFKTFIPLSDIHPEKNYNWLRAELKTLKTANGSIIKGILYKPENFDHTKKYPIIFYYYELFSDKLNEYLVPQFSNGALNIPSFVSNGYLVFTPDIHFELGKTGESTFNSVVQSAILLAKMPWVDTKRMGIQGISFGGYETNYLVTHTHLFAAACSASGGSDFVSYYGSLMGSGASQQTQFESGQYRIGASLWQRPDLYIKNSPIFRADQVTTPLLLMATPNDGAVPFSQAIEFFTALRRLGKRVWMLQYNDGHHTVSGRSAVDFTVRLFQFFDHYLKGAPEPIWMHEDVRPSQKIN